MSDSNEADFDLPEVGPWAKDKLTRLGKYLAAYTTILKEYRFRYFFIDSFAAAGHAKVRASDDLQVELSLIDLGRERREDPGEQEVIKGSPAVALSLRHPFQDYVFIEKSKARIRHLEQLKKQHPQRQVHIREQDCNEYLLDFVQNRGINWRGARGVVFLDPFGLQVPWTTIEALAATRGLEVIINFPLYMGIQRLLKRSAEFTPEERAKLDSYFGSPEWFELSYKKPETLGLFPGSAFEKRGDSNDALLKWYCGRLRSAFGHVSQPYLVRTERNQPLYYLIWAGPNDKGLKIANHVLGK